MKNNKIDESEWQEVIGVSEEEVQDAFVDAFPSSSDALKAEEPHSLVNSTMCSKYLSVN